MKPSYLSDLKPNQVFTATFLVHGKDVRQKKSGEPYLSLLLGDRSGEIDAKMWDNVAEVVDTFERDDFVKVKGLLQIFQNRLQMTVHKMARVLDADVDFADFFPASSRDPLEMFAELRALVAGMRNPHLRALLEAFLNDEPLARMYRTAPAAKHVHHAYLGGLIEHVLSVCRLCYLTSSHYGNVDYELLLTGAVLHDIGKVAELTYDRSFGYSTEGQLLGHIVIGLRMLHEKLQQVPDFPPKLRVLVEHLIVSHHGELEYGSPKVPLFPEAMLLHHLDNLDSKMECMRALAEKDRHIEGCWTGYSPSLERSVLKKPKYLEDGPTSNAPAPDVAAESAPPASVQAPEPAPAPEHRQQVFTPSQLSIRRETAASMAQGSLTEPASSTTTTKAGRGNTLRACPGGFVHRLLLPLLHLARSAGVLHRRRHDEPVRVSEQARQRPGERQHLLLDALLPALRRHRLSQPLRHFRLQSVPSLRSVLRGHAGEFAVGLFGAEPDWRIARDRRHRHPAVLLPWKTRLLYYNAGSMYDAFCFLFYFLALLIYLRARLQGRLLRVWETLGFLACFDLCSQFQGDGARRCR